MAGAQLSSQSMGVLRFGPCGAAITLPSGPIAGSRSGRNVDLGGRRPGRWVEPAFASAAGKAKRSDKRAYSCNPGKAQVGRTTQFGPSSIGGTIADQT